MDHYGGQQNAQQQDFAGMGQGRPQAMQEAPEMPDMGNLHQPMMNNRRVAAAKKQEEDEGEGWDTSGLL